MAKYASFQMTVTDEAGSIVPAATVEVRAHTSGQPLVPLFSTRNGTTLGNPITTDDDGFFRFFAAAGAYQITATKGDFTRVWTYVAVGTAAEYDARDLVFAVPMNFQASGKFTSSLPLMPVIAPLALTLDAADTTGWFAKLRVAPTADRVISMVKNGVEFATITFLSGLLEGTFTMAADVDLVAGDQVWLIMPSSVDTNMSDLSVVIIARRQ